jgi:periplasmic protein CpxP/Spy
MKKFALFCAMLFALTINVQAQSAAEAPKEVATEKAKGKGKGGKNKGEMASQAKNAANELGLNEEQKTKMKTAAATLKGKMQAIRTDNSLAKDQKKTQLQEANAAHDAEIKSILTAEQFTKWTEIKKNRQDKMKEKAKDRKGNKASDDDNGK